MAEELLWVLGPLHQLCRVAVVATGELLFLPFQRMESISPQMPTLEAGDGAAIGWMAAQNTP